jgi:DNA-binding protein H-NS
MKNPERKTHDAESDAEKIAAIRKIRKLMDFWRISPKELRGRPTGLPSQPAVPVEIRYCHPVSGDTWDGRGAQPQWLRDALLREGYTVDELRQAAQARQIVADAGAPLGADRA